jgi:trehalose 6-phosphate synthase
VGAAMRDRDGLWFGWSGTVADAPSPPTTIEHDSVQYVVTDLKPNDFDEYYNGFANRALWPLLHYRVDLAEYLQTDFQGYRRVNDFFADRLSPLLRPDDLIWVHDYHLMPLARALRERGHKNRIGFFLHIPMPPYDLIQTLPTHREAFGALTDFDVIGFQTNGDAENFSRYALRVLGASTENGNTYKLNKQQFQVGVFPVGIEPIQFHDLARKSLATKFMGGFDRGMQGKRLVFGVDRLDYSKGILNRVQAFEKFLESSHEWWGKVTYLQVAPKSREDIPEYEQMYEKVSSQIGQINGRFGEIDWVPLRYVNRNYQREAIAGMLARADVGLVTPLRDGMNLVAKEFVAAQDPDDPGVLVLSEFAGAAAQLKQALIVNPHDVQSVSLAISKALQMDRIERMERYQSMMTNITAYDIAGWAESFLKALSDPTGTESTDRRHFVKERMTLPI